MCFFRSGLVASLRVFVVLGVLRVEKNRFHNRLSVYVRARSDKVNGVKASVVVFYIVLS
jgi:hypothetical protein